MSSGKQSNDSINALAPKHSNSELTANDPDLPILAAYLEKTAPLGAVDPAFHDSLYSRLINIQTEYYESRVSQEGDKSHKE